MLSVPYPSPFADPNTAGAKLLVGVNYASAAAGILDESGQHYVCILVAEKEEKSAFALSLLFEWDENEKMYGCRVNGTA